MENLSYEGKEFEFWGKTGVVLSSEKRTETTAHQTPGRVDAYGKNIDITMPTTQFKSVLKHEFWIKKEDGTEESIRLNGVDIPLRPEQTITMVYAAEKGKSGCEGVLVNHSAGNFWFINDTEELIKKLNVFNYFGKSLLIAIATLYAVDIFLTEVFSFRSAENFAFFVAAGVFSYSVFVGFRRKLKFKNLLGAHLESLARNILQKT